MRVRGSRAILGSDTGLGRWVGGEEWTLQPPGHLPSSLPPAGAAATGSVAAAAGLVLADGRLHLLAAVATIIVAMVLLVERYGSRHPPQCCACLKP